MLYLIYILGLFWFLRETRAILFWIYLWQLKEYHIGRFVDHFRTEKGKTIFLNFLLLLKVILVFVFFQLIFRPSSPCQIYFGNLFLSYSLIIIYFFESAKGFFDFFKKRLRKPALTKKTVFLIFIIFLFQIFYFSSFLRRESFSFSLLIFDIFTPAVVSGIILIFQPLTVLMRNRIIKRAIEKRKKFKDLIVIGITGSYGKTSTKEFLAKILSEKFKVLKTKAHQNSEVGISQCILNDLKPEHQIFVVEMGAYNKGGIKLLCNIAKPKIGILTGINEQHMATFGSQKKIIETKYELIESLPEDGLAIFNGSDPHVFRLYQKTKKPKRIFGYQKMADSVPPDLFARDIVVKKDSLSFKVCPKEGEPIDFKVNLLGIQNIPNLLSSILVARELRMSFSEIKRGCKKIRAEQGAMQLIKTKRGLNIIDSTYSANPDGVIAHLEYLKIWKGKKIIVMPCLIELGRASKRVHQKIGETIAKVCDLAIITTKDKFLEIKKGAINNGMPEENILFLEKPEEIFEKIKSFCFPSEALIETGPKEDVVLLESRVPSKIIKLLAE